jgi:hypothetical protein
MNKDAPHQGWALNPIHVAVTICLTLMLFGIVIYGAAHPLSWAGRLFSTWGGGAIAVTMLVVNAGIQILLMRFGIPLNVRRSETVIQSRNADTSE